MENQVHDLTSSISTSLSIPNQTMRIQIPVAMLTENGSQWNHALIFSLLDGGHINPNHVMRTVKLKWKITEVCDMVRAGYNRFICRFSNVNDQDRIEEQQPWVVMGCLILIETYSTGMVAANITFDRLPLWLSFKGLELEHLNSETVKLIGEAAGSVTSVLPRGVIPRSAEGFRAQVQVNVNEPLVQGQFVNTLANGDIWVAFKYNNLPSLFCTLCHRLGHDRHHCTFPAAIAPNQLNQTVHQSSFLPSPDSPANKQMILWPHEFNQAQTQATQVQVTREPSKVSSDCRQGLTLLNNMGLDSIEFKSSQQGTNFTNKAHRGNTYNLESPNANMNHLVHHHSPSPSPFIQQRNIRTEQQPLCINEPSPNGQSTRTGRGRLIGSTNKIPKAPKDQKGKGKLHSCDNVQGLSKQKKRKIAPAESSSIAIHYIQIPPAPPPIFTTRCPISNNQPSSNLNNHDLFSQMYANPVLTNLLLQQGALNP
ncbi:hypothetical protein FRX31_032033, partial [Thalictrum thalictroides]